MTAAEKPATAALGDVWEVKVTKGARVEVTRPDDATVTVAESNGVVTVVLDVPGTYTVSADYGGATITAK